MDVTETILTLETEVQARLLDAILTDLAIPHVMRSYGDSAYNGVFQRQKGWGVVEAPARCREEILAVFKDLDGKPPRFDDTPSGATAG